MKISTLEERHARDEYRMLCEAMDMEKLDAIAQAFGKLDNILRGLNIPIIEDALDKARADAQKLLTGDQGFLKKALGAIGIGGAGKVVQKVMNTQLQLASMLNALPNILKIAGRDLPEKIAQNPEASVSELFEEDGKTNQIYKMVAQSLKPKMLEGGLAINPDEAAQEIMNLPGKDFLQLMTRAKGSNFKMPVKPEDVKPAEGGEGEVGDTSGITPPENPGREHLGAALEALKKDVKAIEGAKHIIQIIQSFGGNEAKPDDVVKIMAKLGNL